MKKFFLILFLLSFGYASAQKVEMVYHFKEPNIISTDNYHQINFEGCKLHGEVGFPNLPYYPVSLLLPQGYKASSVDIIFSDFVEIEGEYTLYPAQRFIPYSRPDLIQFSKNEEIYRSANDYPTKSHSEVITQYLNGYAFALLNFTPLRYVPSTGKVEYASTVKVEINIVAEKSDHSSMIWNTPYNIKSISDLAQNPEMISSYKTRNTSLPGYDMLIITKDKYIKGFSPYIDYYNSIGIRTKIVGTKMIFSDIEGQDYQEKIRNYIKQEYQNEGISLVTLGGDVTIIPHKDFYSSVNDGELERYDIPADMYYSNLDGTWNDDGDDKWGEIEEADLLPEIGISRMSFTSNTTQETLIHKTLSYQCNPISHELRDIVLGSEKADDETYGGDYLELIIGYREDNDYATTGIPEDYHFNRIYAEHGTWSKANFMNAINYGSQSIHHVGHANPNYIAGMGINDITDDNFSSLNGIDNNFTYMYSHGCSCAAFDKVSIMERMTTINNFCFAIIGNSREGFYLAGETEGPAAHLHREMINAQYGNNQDILAMAVREAKIKTAPWAIDVSAYLWNIYCLNIIGDGAASIWIDKPYTPKVIHNSTIIAGNDSYEIVVRDNNDIAMQGIRCMIFKNDELIGSAITDSQGYANIIFEDNIENMTKSETLQLKINGPNIFPQTDDIIFIPDNSPYVTFINYHLNDDNNIIEHSETHSLDVTFKNSGLVADNNITATLSCDRPEYVNITKSVTQIDEIMGNSEINLKDAFAFEVSGHVPNETNVNFYITTTNGTESHQRTFNAKIYSPIFRLFKDKIEIDDSSSNGDNHIEAGESATIYFTMKNYGGCDAENISFKVICPSSDFYYDENETIIDNLAVSDTFTFAFTFTLDECTPDAYYELFLSTSSGEYNYYEPYYIVIGSDFETFETGDFSSHNWQFTNSDEIQWEIDNTDPYQGEYCAKAEFIGEDDGNTDLFIEVESIIDTEISFYKKLSTDNTYLTNCLTFYIDDKIINDWYGNIDWSKSSYKLPKGKHVLKWRFLSRKLYEESTDYAMIDNIVLPPSVTILDINITEEKIISIYPNPNNGTFYVEFPDNENYTIQIYDILGNKMYEQEDVIEKTLIGNERLKSGLYFVKAFSKNNIFTKKILVGN